MPSASPLDFGELSLATLPGAAGGESRVSLQGPSVGFWPKSLGQCNVFSSNKGTLGVGECLIGHWEVSSIIFPKAFQVGACPGGWYWRRGRKAPVPETRKQHFLRLPGAQDTGGHSELGLPRGRELAGPACTAGSPNDVGLVPSPLWARSAPWSHDGGPFVSAQWRLNSPVSFLFLVPVTRFFTICFPQQLIHRRSSLSPDR